MVKRRHCARDASSFLQGSAITLTEDSRVK